MAHGIIVKNDDGHLLVSSDVKAFHYAQDATLVSSEGGETNFKGDALDGSELSGRFLHSYRVYIPEGVEPLVFLYPGNQIRYGLLTKALASTAQGLGQWNLTVIQHGKTKTPPARVLVFSQLPADATPEGWGVVTRMGNGELAFDSTRSPLVIEDTAMALPPKIPCDGGLPAAGDNTRFSDERSTTANHNFKCENTEAGYAIPSDVAVENLAFTAPSLVQACYDHKTTNVWYTWVSFIVYTEVTLHSWQTQHWCLYQGGFRVDRNSRQLKSGWITYAADYGTEEKERVYQYIGPFSVGTNDGPTHQLFSAPYVRQTINYFENPVLMIDATKYPVEDGYLNKLPA